MICGTKPVGACQHVPPFFIGRGGFSSAAHSAKASDIVGEKQEKPPAGGFLADIAGDSAKQLANRTYNKRPSAPAPSSIRLEVSDTTGETAGPMACSSCIPQSSTAHAGRDNSSSVRRLREHTQKN